MRKRREAARFVNLRKHVFRTRPPARHECRASPLQPDLERFVGTGHIAPRHERSSDPGPAHRFRRIVNGRLKDGVQVETNAALRQAIDYLARAVQPGASLLREKCLQCR